MCRDGVSCQLYLTIHSFSSRFCSCALAAVKYTDSASFKFMFNKNTFSSYSLVDFEAR